ncbi:uncharacterized protein Z518_05856 [Rhinocladiella mackenziei CBS 650.93]|uniref:L-ornithine N(5)-oxygenase n=1 Tax=Rhinocladiella mackenziei CBS 650.93 TaxID=1442369 RepID=A0A0D2IGW0_9EURO|nr:uncharacterized protein Z518_05856 [Rhinocladiella mackenziei CBS 650.93]KIX04984.1 hypothetical protein Z518_05856 [Rhinocladiella mackenziei CBS 650.93]
METFDLVLVGAGWHGLAMAKTYSEICPESSMLILDSSNSIGGTWAQERLYPGLKTNNIFGSYEFGDFPMTPEKYGLEPMQHIPGNVVHDYLYQIAAKFNLLSRIRLQTKVDAAELQESGEWLLRLCTAGAQNRQIPSVMAKKVVIATGLTSEPFIPNYVGRESFAGNFLHSRNLKDHEHDIRTSREVVVVGANKSAWDVCYFAATSGAHVNMVIRPGGGGPSWVWPAVFSPIKLSIQRLANTRFFTLFEPCIWAEGSGFNWARRLLHGTWLGRKIVSLFWKALAYPVHSANRYSSHRELEKLKPWSSMFWMANSLGIHNYEENWFELVKQGKISVHVADITSLSGNKVALSNSEIVNADTLVCCTGWKVVPAIKFFPERLAAQLGFPGTVPADNDTLIQRADEEIFRAVPELRSGPAKVLPPGSTSIDSSTVRATNTSTPIRLYRFMIPSARTFLEQRNLAFIGAHLALNAITVAQAQALWITAFFQNEIPHLDPSTINYSAIQYQTVLHSEYCRLRHPPAGGGAGERCPDLLFDGLLYTDLLLRDVGIDNFRKRGVWQELFHRYSPKDYAGITKELSDRIRKTRASS